MKDVLDLEPFVDMFFPRRIKRWLARIALLLLVFVPAAVPWLIHQVDIHVRHETEPLIAKMIASLTPSTTTTLIVPVRPVGRHP